MSSSDKIFGPVFPLELISLTREKRLALLRQFWSTSAVDQNCLDDFDGNYLEFVSNEIKQIQHHRTHFAAQDMDTIFNIIDTLRNNLHLPCGEILRLLSSQYINFDPVATRRSLELSARLWLTINIRSSHISLGPTFAGDVPIEWDPHMSLDALIQAHLIKATYRQASKGIDTIDVDFTAAYLVNTCGMKLKWTDDMSQHLFLDLKRTVLTVYRHKVCLIGHLAEPQGCPFPEEFLEEIIDTFNILFPFGDRDTGELLKREGQRSIYTLGSCSRRRNLELMRYQYFGASLERLIEAFEKAPRTWKQLALDRTNKLEWSAFWVTAMVAILTVISIPCNIIQATYSVKAYRLAQTQITPGVGAGQMSST